MLPIRHCSVSDQQPLQASKWLQTQLLIDVNEMEQMIQALGDFWIFVTGLAPKGAEPIPPAEFLAVYSDYIAALKGGKIPDETPCRSLFSGVFTRTTEALYALESGSELIIRPSQPVVQLQLHRLGFSHADHKFRPMVFGPDSLYWGIQFSYPQVYQDPVSRQIYSVDDSPKFPNTALFRTLQRWVRHNTLPTPFLVDGQRINVPMRLGKAAFKWINHHPQLAQHGLSIIS